MPMGSATLPDCQNLAEFSNSLLRELRLTDTTLFSKKMAENRARLICKANLCNIHLNDELLATLMFQECTAEVLFALQESIKKPTTAPSTRSTYGLSDAYNRFSQLIQSFSPAKLMSGFRTNPKKAPSTLNIGDDIDVTRICKTSTWHNNCGFNCLSHYFVHKLKTGTLTDNNMPQEYDEFLDTFQTYYQLPHKPTWQHIHDLITEYYTSPRDQERLFAPALRLHLGNILKRPNPILEDIFVVVMNLVKSGGTLVDDFDKIYVANHDYIVRDLIDTMNGRVRSDEEHQSYWRREGAKNYANAIANMNNNIMISADNLGLLCKSFGIGLSYYAIEEGKVTWTQSKTDDVSYPENITVYHQGAHWTYHEFSHEPAATAAHNACYEHDDPTQNLIAPNDDIESLKEMVREKMNLLDGAVLKNGSPRLF